MALCVCVEKIIVLQTCLVIQVKFVVMATFMLTPYQQLKSMNNKLQHLLIENY